MYTGLSLENAVMLAKTDPAAMEYLLRKYKNFIAATVSPFFLVGADDDDLCQEGAIAFTLAVKQYISMNRGFLKFASVVIRRHIYQLIRQSYYIRNKAMTESCQLEAAVIESFPDDNSVENIVIRRNDDAAFYRWLSGYLSEIEYKVAVCLLQGMNTKQVWRYLDRDYKSVDNAIQRIRRKLKITYAEEGFYEADIGNGRSSRSSMASSAVAGQCRV